MPTRECMLCIHPIVYNNSHCPCCMVSNPSPFRAALKILGILPYSLLLVDLIFFSPPLRISQVYGLARSNESKLACCRIAFLSTEKSGETEPPRLSYIRTDWPCSVSVWESAGSTQWYNRGIFSWTGDFRCPPPPSALGTLACLSCPVVVWTDRTEAVLYFINKSVLFVAYKIRSFYNLFQYDT